MTISHGFLATVLEYRVGQLSTDAENLTGKMLVVCPVHTELVTVAVGHCASHEYLMDRVGEMPRIIFVHVFCFSASFCKGAYEDRAQCLCSSLQPMDMKGTLCEMSSSL